MADHTMDQSTDQRLVAIYGSAGVQAGSEDWATAHAVGRALAGAGYGLLSGGFSGVMEAASQGAAEAGGRVVGVTVGLFKARGLRPNRWVQEEVELPTLHERLLYMVERPDAIVVLRGGVGTLSEFMLAWSLVQVGQIPPRPVVLVGALWRRLIDLLADDALIPPHELARLTLVEGAAGVVPALEAWWSAPPDLPLRIGDTSPPP